MFSYEHPHIKDFFQYPLLPYIYVNKNGVIYDDKIACYLEFSQFEDYYPSYKGILVHRIVAETFLDKPKDIDEKDLVVNHLDGNKRNNISSNLEWTTYTGNIIHAYKNGLRADNHVVLLRKIGGHEIQKFYSLQETARYLGVNGYKVHAYLKNRFNRRPFLEKYFLTYEGESWPDEKRALSLSDYNCGLPTDFVVIDTKETKTFVVEGYKMVEELTQISYNKLKYLLQKARKKGNAVTIDQFKICHLENYKGYLSNKTQHIKSEIVDTRFNGKKLRPPKPIIVTNLQTHEKYNLDGIKTLAKQFNVKKNTLQKHIWKNNGIWRNKFKVEYV